MSTQNTSLANYKTKVQLLPGSPANTEVYGFVPLPKQIPELDGFRGLAVLLVMMGHFLAACKIQVLAIHPLIGLVLFKAYSQGGHGVDLFFVLSGFLITGILLDAKGQKNYFRNFYMRRFLRIFPLYYGVLFICLVALPFAWPFSRELFSVILANQKWLWLYAINIPPFSHLAFYNSSINFVHFWSLAVEEHFYIMWPLAIFMLNRRQSIKLGVLIVLLAIALRSILLTAGADPWTVGTFTLCRMDSLAIGGLIAALIRSRNGHLIVAWAKPCAIILGFICLLIMSRRSGSIPNDLDSTCFALFGGALLILSFTSRPSAVWRRFCNNGFMRFSGKISYGLYVYHFLFLGVLSNFLRPQWLSENLHSNALAVVLFTLFAGLIFYFVAFISWNIYEKQILKFKRCFE